LEFSQTQPAGQLGPTSTEHPPQHWPGGGATTQLPANGSVQTHSLEHWTPSAGAQAAPTQIGGTAQTRAVPAPPQVSGAVQASQLDPPAPQAASVVPGWQ
jgi:hypothetical protein